MSKRNNLYVVYAGVGKYCTPVYESPKRDKAEAYAHALMRDPKCEYNKIYIEVKPITQYNKRDIDWED